MALDEAQRLDGGVVAFSAAAQQCPLVEVIEDLVPQCVLLFLGGSDRSVEDGSGGEGVKDLVRQSSDDIRIGTVQLCPAFFQDHHPNFLLCRRLRKAYLAVAADRKVIIDQDLLQDTVVQNPGHVESVRVDVQFGEERFDSIVLFGQRGQRTQEIAVSQRALEDVRGGDRAIGEDSIRQDVFDALPSEAVEQFVVQLAQGLLVGREIRVGEGLISASHLADEFFVVGLLDLPDE